MRFEIALAIEFAMFATGNLLRAMNNKIAVVGSSNMDLVMKVPRIPGPGQTIADGVFSQSAGGKGVNQALAAARAGGDVSFIGCLGADNFAENIMEVLEKNNVDTTNVFQVSGVYTGTAIITVDDDGENSISVAPGANYFLNDRHIAKASPALLEARIILLQGELHPAILRHVLQWASNENKEVMLNLAPAQPLEKEYLNQLALLVINEVEASVLLGQQIKGPSRSKRAAETLAELTKGGVIISMGENGSYLVRDDLKETVPAFRVKAVDITGAGDVYCGSLAAALVEGMSVLEAIRFATAAAAISVSRLGAQPSIPFRREIEEFLTFRKLN